MLGPRFLGDAFTTPPPACHASFRHPALHGGASPRCPGPREASSRGAALAFRHGRLWSVRGHFSLGVLLFSTIRGYVTTCSATSLQRLHQEAISSRSASWGLILVVVLSPHGTAYGAFDPAGAAARVPAPAEYLSFPARRDHRRSIQAVVSSLSGVRCTRPRRHARPPFYRLVLVSVGSPSIDVVGLREALLTARGARRPHRDRAFGAALLCRRGPCGWLVR